METSIGTIGNYYGGLSVKKEGEKYFWGIENYDGTKWEEIPKKMYDRLIYFEKQRVREQKQNGA
jgi:hypothetical protein